MKAVLGRLRLEGALKCRSCGTRRYKPPVHLVKLTESARSRPIYGFILMMSGKTETSIERNPDTAFLAPNDLTMVAALVIDDQVE
jgi:hypothetical protein